MILLSLTHSNDGQLTITPPFAGERIDIELFIDGANTLQTTGFKIVFDNDLENFRDNFEIDKISGIVPQFRSPSPVAVETSAEFPSAVTSNNYIDLLNVSQAAIAFRLPEFSLSLDLDPNPGDQKVRQVFGIGEDQEVSIQIFGENIKSTIGFIGRFDFNTSEVNLIGFDPGDVFPNVQSLVALEGTQAVVAEVTSGSLGGAATSESGLMGTLRFLTTPDFRGGRIRLLKAEIRRSGRFVALTLPTTLNLILRSPIFDFDNDGLVGFRDFLLFAERFGSHRGDSIFDSLFDLDADGSVGFSDFLIFVSFFSPPEEAP